MLLTMASTAECREHAAGQAFAEGLRVIVDNMCALMEVKGPVEELCGDAELKEFIADNGYALHTLVRLQKTKYIVSIKRDPLCIVMYHIIFSLISWHIHYPYLYMKYHP